MLHDRLISRSKQNCESLTYLASQCDERLLRTGKLLVTASDVRNIGKKNRFRPRKRRKYSETPKILSTSRSVQKLSVC